ncbi:hypothetical protein INS49_006588 [Diaporthe citri]|uniref:uncharacterized protein n=1 Tax=Diaporthe citri TaxID=83186 RepID=UPI001C811FFF|nr:uncharacterized protein INS49_006588 [Diaporthe citri]KAG6364983.1 hypothetical protein INS49_006588 [Diaporthe citri]
MPDLRDSTNHLAPLALPTQLVYYYGYMEGRFGLEDTPRFPIIRAERSRLRDWLLTKIPVQWGRKAERVEYNDDGAEVFFHDGTSAKGDFVVGADGANSIVRESLLQKPSSELLSHVPLSAIVGEVTLSGDAFRRQMALGYSAYNLINPELGFIGFVGLHQALPDGQSGQFYWMLMQPDQNIAEPNHWLHSSTQREKLDHVLETVAPLAAPLREIFELTPADGIRRDLHAWKDLELEHLPAGRTAILGDAAHAMTPAGGMGAFHALIDAMKLGQALCKLNGEDTMGNIAVVRATVAEFNGEMLGRGAAAVRSSRDSYEGAKRRAETKEHFTRGLRPLPAVKPEDIVLEIKA